MFVELAALIQNGSKLTVTIFPGTEGRIKVCVAPTAEKGKEPALATPLTLTATPQELDEGFAGAIATYQASRTSLAAQIETTAAVINQATKSQSSKAVKALDKAAKTSPTTARIRDADDEADSASAGITAEDAASTPAAQAASGTDLSTLI